MNKYIITIYKKLEDKARFFIKNTQEECDELIERFLGGYENINGIMIDPNIPNLPTGSLFLSGYNDDKTILVSILHLGDNNIVPLIEDPEPNN